VKKLGLAVLGLVLASALIITGCSASSSASASRIAESSAKRSDSIVGKLEVIDDAQFNFPLGFGSNFFKSDVNAGFEPRHFDIDDLNLDNPERIAFMNQLDDLYKLCADIVAGNRVQAQIIRDIRQETSIMRCLSEELSTQKIKDFDWAEFNRARDDIDTAVSELRRDRNKIERKLRVLPRSTVNINPEAMSTRFMKVMDRIDARVEMLESLKFALFRMNLEMQNAMGKNEPVIHSWVVNP